MKNKTTKLWNEDYKDGLKMENKTIKADANSSGELTNIKLVGLFIILIFINGCEKEEIKIEKITVENNTDNISSLPNYFEGMVTWDETHPNYYRKEAYCTICQQVVWTDRCNCYGCERGNCWNTLVGCYAKEDYTWDGNLTGTHWLEIEEAKERGLI